MQKFSMVIHGGAGTIVKEDMTPELELAYQHAMEEALQAGYAILENKGSAFHAVKAAIVVLEDNPLFNAGRGSVFTKKGLQEMDAAIMNGNLQAGAVAGIRHVRNPIELAAEVMTNSDHVFLSGEGAIDFALKQGMRLEADEYFFSPFRYDQWKAMRDSEQYVLDHTQESITALMKDKKFGTVGAVACDANGDIAAATSTGGMTNKKYGRIGDTPVIGAGTYANNDTCAISCTGHGEPFIKAVAAYDVSCLMEYKGMSLQDAMNEVVMVKLVKMNGEGGMIGVDKAGNTAMIFNTAGMYRAMKTSAGQHQVSIYKD
jgi:L-asparaginase / beta-aspartyl-peptidase